MLRGFSQAVELVLRGKERCNHQDKKIQSNNYRCRQRWYYQ